MRLIHSTPRVLLVNPETPDSYWGFQGAVGFLGARAAHIPLSLVTVASLLPADWPVRLVDMNVERLRDSHIAWADVVMLTGMIVQKDSIEHVLERCAMHRVPTIVGGPFVSSSPDDPSLSRATSLAEGEAEDDGVMKAIVADLRNGTMRRRYAAGDRPAMDSSPVPRFDLLRRGAYCAMAIQVSRGCPHLCEFCNVRQLFGRRPRYKSPEQVTTELAAIAATGYRGNVFVVDDNFIGDVRAADAIVDAISRWQTAMRRPFLFYTEADIRLADRETLARKMVDAGFFSVFVGFESPSKEALKEASKHQNVKVDAVDAVRKLGRLGFMVYGGFIVGFDADGPDIFEAVERFIEDAGIDFAMAGMLTAIQGTQLEQRMRSEGRLIRESDGDAFGLSNIVPKSMPALQLVRGYRRLLTRLYEPRRFFDRAFNALAQWTQRKRRKAAGRELMAVVRSIVRQGVIADYRRDYWRFMVRVLFHDPRKLPRAFAQAISGHHFFRYTRDVVVPRLLREERRLATTPALVRDNCAV